MALQPKPGLVIRYDFLWKDEARAGHTEGRKDRPCLILAVKAGKVENTNDALLLPITHTPPTASEKASSIEIPYKISQHLKLDHERMWIRTHQVNTVVWDKRYTPEGVVPVKKNQPVYGQMHKDFESKIKQQLFSKHRAHTVENVRRDLDPYIKKVMDEKDIEKNYQNIE